MSYETHPELPDIKDPDTVLWRYVDLYKWLDLLQTSELHLTRADQMEDRWEGAYSEVNVAVRDEKQGDRRKDHELQARRCSGSASACRRINQQVCSDGSIIRMSGRGSLRLRRARTRPGSPSISG
jgi:hypothetical protein